MKLLFKALRDFAENNDININYRQFPKAANALVKLNAIKSNVREGFGIVIEIERDSNNNSVITVCRRKQSIKSSSPLPNYYYAIQVQQKHIQAN